MSNLKRTVLYIGSTNNIEVRVLEHRFLRGSEYTYKYKCFYLVYFESHPSIGAAVAREKQLKNWRREWKLNLIRKLNPQMEDLSYHWYTKEEIASFKEANNLI